jgi:hypothetical protein
MNKYDILFPLWYWIWFNLANFYLIALRWCKARRYGFLYDMFNLNVSWESRVWKTLEN